MSTLLIDEGHKRFLAAMRANDADALMAELTDDVIFMPPGQAPAVGKAAVRAWYEATMAEASTVKVSVPEREVVVAGDWGIERGRYVWGLVPAGGGSAFEVRGNFIAIWRPISDGVWKVSSDIWNSSDPV
jgi:ketosteroid isomerase-like protein